MLDPLEPVIRKLIEEWPEIKAPRRDRALRDEYGYRARSTWSESGSPSSARRASAPRSGPATDRPR